jgi:SAM-dependent methyltransferase
MMEETSLHHQLEKIRGFERGYRATHVLNWGSRLGLIQALSGAIDGMAVPELAMRLMLFEPYVRVWCQTAYHFEILDCDASGRFSLQPFLAEVLGITPQCGTASPQISLPASSILEDANDETLLNYFRTGEPIRTQKTPEESRATLEATKSVYILFFSQILPQHEALKRLLEKGINFLDLGCGGGYLIIELAHAFTNSRFVGLDPDIHGIIRAEEAIAQFGLDDRLVVEDLAAEDMPYHHEFEIICLVATLHEILPEVRKQAMHRIYRALKQGGYLLMLDFPYPNTIEDFRNPRYDFGIIEQYFEAPKGIIHLSMDQQNDLLTRVGFTDIRRTDIGEGTFDCILARKRESQDQI